MPQVPQRLVPAVAMGIFRVCIWIAVWAVAWHWRPCAKLCLYRTLLAGKYMK